MTFRGDVFSTPRDERRWDLYDQYPCLEGIRGYHRARCSCVNCAYVHALVPYTKGV